MGTIREETPKIIMLSQPFGLFALVAHDCPHPLIIRYVKSCS